MNIYFNAEYTGINEHSRLISLGFVTEENQKLYIEVANVPEYLLTTEISTFVLPDTYIYDTSVVNSDHRIEKGTEDSADFDYRYVVVYNDQIKDVLDRWFKKQIDSRDEDKIQLVSYCCHYDFCLLLNLFQGSIPEYLNPVCYDIYQDMINKLTQNDRPLSKRVADILDSSPLTIENDLPQYPKEHALKFAHLIKFMYEHM